MFIVYLVSTIVFATPARVVPELNGVARVGFPAREFVAPNMTADLATTPVGLEAALVVRRPLASLGWRVAIGLDGWTRRWRDLTTGQVWDREYGFRLEPRVALRWILAPYRLWTYRFDIVPTIDVGLGAAMVLFIEKDAGWGAASPTLSVRPALHLGRESPVIVGIDLRAGIRRTRRDCPTCLETRLDPGGTSVGLTVGGVLR